jgi:uncharacterized protein
MSRPKTTRKIADKPHIAGLKPYGITGTAKKSEAIFLLYEEYEALRLCDYDGYNQCEAAKLMGVSRPTLTRICMSARHKVSATIVEGHQLIIEGGKIEINHEWMRCNHCHCFFTKQQAGDSACPLCGSNDIEEISEDTRDNDIGAPLQACCNSHRRRKSRCQRWIGRKGEHLHENSNMQ